MSAFKILHHGGSDSIVIADTASHDDVAEVFHNDRHTVAQTADQALATARLFVAASDMLAVLYQYVDDLRYPPTGDSIQRRIERAEAAIAKAIGGVHEHY